MDAVKYKIIWFWLTKLGFLRRLGKRYPDWFNNQYIPDLTDNLTARKIMELRYTGATSMKFEAIAIELNIDVRNVFAHHKTVLDAIIYGK